VQTLEDQLLADRGDAIGRRRAEARGLNRLVKRVGLFATDEPRAGTRGDFRRVADLSRYVSRDARKRRREKLRDGRIRVIVQQRDEPSQLYAVRMRLDFRG
jgi:hypothetical protein